MERFRSLLRAEPRGAPEPPDAAPALAQLRLAAVALMIVAIAGFVLAVLRLAWALSTDPAPASTTGAFATISSGLATASALVSVPATLVLFYGARKMKELENYRLAVAACVLAMLPCTSPACLLGLPVGLWALVVLLSPEARAAFQR